MARPAPRELTAEEVGLCLNMRGQGTDRYSLVGWTRIARRLGLSRHAVLRHFAPQELTSYKRVTLTAHEVGAGIPSARNEPPLPVLEERDRAFLVPQSGSSALLGDPPAGRSALDKKRMNTV